jgi:hypothetical protein
MLQWWNRSLTVIPWLFRNRSLNLSNIIMESMHKDEPQEEKHDEDDSNAIADEEEE